MTKKVLIFTLMLGVLAIAGVIYIKSVQIKNTSVKTQLLPETVIQVEAKKWQFLPQIINVKKGYKVKIIINNIDGPHGMYIPEFNVSGKQSVEFTANKVGEFPFFCNFFCENCKTMVGKLIVT